MDGDSFSAHLPLNIFSLTCRIFFVYFAFINSLGFIYYMSISVVYTFTNSDSELQKNHISVLHGILN